jgi:hypothetical protein
VKNEGPLLRFYKFFSHSRPTHLFDLLLRYNNVWMWYNYVYGIAAVANPWKWFNKISITHALSLRVFKNRVLRRISGPKRDEVTGEWRSCIMGSFVICTHHQILLGRSNQGEWGEQGLWQAQEREERVQGFCGKARGKEATWKTKA